MKRWRILLITLLAVIFVGPWNPVEQAASAPETIKVGAAVSLSGPFGSQGREQKVGYQIGVNDVNQEGGIYVKEFGKKIPMELIVLDDESDPVKLVSRLETLDTMHKVVAYFGGFGSSMHAVGAVTAEKNKIPYLGVAFALYSIHQQGYKYLFSPFPKSPQQAVGHFDLLDSIPKNMRPQKIAIFEIEDDAGKESSGFWRKEAAKRGYTIVCDKKHPLSCKDFSPLLMAAKSAGAEVLLSYPTPGDTITMVKQMKQLDVNFKLIIAMRTAPGDVWFKALGEAGNYIISGGPGWHYNVPFPGAKGLISKYEKMTGKSAELMSPSVGSCYTCVQILTNAIYRAGTLDRGKIRDAIAATDMMTVQGRITFNPDGTPNMPFLSFQYQRGKSELIGLPGPDTKPLLYPIPKWSERSN
ncbi:MAG: amino acid ABC transporter substrate-binding protein [Thermodesulfobacteriota bacterium]